MTKLFYLLLSAGALYFAFDTARVVSESVNLAIARF